MSWIGKINLYGVEAEVGFSRKGTSDIEQDLESADQAKKFVEIYASLGKAVKVR